MIAGVKPNITVGMPVFNGGQMFERALQEIRAQTEHRIEVVISDNGSNDGTQKFCEMIAKQDPRIRYFRQQIPISAYANFHFVLSHAKSDYFMWAAHNDYRDRDFLEKLVDSLRKNPQAICAFSDMYEFTDLQASPHDDLRLVQLKYDFQTVNYTKMGRLIKTCFNQGFVIYGVWKTEVAKKIPYNDCLWGSDLPMMMAAACMGEFVHVKSVRFFSFYEQKTGAERAKSQSGSNKFNLFFETQMQIWCVFRSVSEVSGVALGLWAALLVTLKYTFAFPGFVYRRCLRLLKKNE